MFAFLVVEFAIGAVPVFAAYLATNGVTPGSVVIVAVTALIMLALAGVMARAGNALLRRIAGADDDTP